jgi:aquaporin related protein
MAPQTTSPPLPLHTRTLRTNPQVPRGRQPAPAPYAPTHHHFPGHHSHGKLRRKNRLTNLGVPNAIRNEIIAFIAEFCGTFMFLFFAFVGTQVANEAATSAGNARDGNHSLAQAPNANTLLYISLCFGFSLATNVWIFFRISGGLFNPVVSLALYLIGAVKAVRALLCFLAQILGGMAAAAVVQAILPGALNISTGLGGGTSIARGLFLEMFLTTELVLAILFLAAEKHKATYLAPIGIGLALFVAELCGVYYTGGSLNPARSFGPAVVVGYFEGYHWIYWLGPTMGALLAVGFYKLMKLSDYETVNPGQDFNDEEAELFKPPTDAETAEDVRRPNATVERTRNVVQAAVQEAVQETVRAISPEVGRKSGDGRPMSSGTVGSGRSTRSGFGALEVGEGEAMARYSQASTLPGGGVLAGSQMERDLEKQEA